MPYLKTNGISTYCEIHGSGRPIIFLHGALVDQRMWLPQITEFQRKYQVVVYDLRGHGKTGPSSTSSYTTGLMANDLVDLMFSLNLRRPVLCGLSLGGLIAQQFATDHPEMISGLVLCDIDSSKVLTVSGKIQSYLYGWSIAPSVRMMGAQRFTNYAFWLAKIMRGENRLGNNEQTREYLHQCMRSLDTKEMIKIYQLTLRSRGVDLNCIKVPTLLINVQSIIHQQRKRAYTPLEMIPVAGRTTNLVSPEKFNMILHNFLSALSQAPFQRAKSTRMMAWRPLQSQ